MRKSLIQQVFVIPRKEIIQSRISLSGKHSKHDRKSLQVVSAVDVMSENSFKRKKNDDVVKYEV